MSTPKRVMMTATQVGLLVESQLSYHPALNTIHICSRLQQEDVDTELLRDALQIIASRHDSLRLMMEPLAKAGPVQWALPHIKVDFKFLDWSDRDPAQSEIALQEFLARNSQLVMPFDKAPPWRVRLIKLAPENSVIIWSAHHAIQDGTALSLIYSELFKVYSDLCDGSEGAAELPPAPSFIEHCAALEQLDHRPAQDYFRQYLAGFDAPNKLDNVFLSHDDTSNQARLMLDRTLGRDSADRLRERAKTWGVTVSDMVLAAWGLVMARCSGRDEAVFGVTRSGRFLLPGAVASGGCRINTLPCRISLAGRSLIDLLTDIRQFALAVRDFEHTPLSAITQVSDLPRTGAPYDSAVMFDRRSLEETHQEICPRFGKVQSQELTQMSGGLLLSAYDNPELELRLEYDPKLYSTEGIARIADYTRAVLIAFSADDLNPQTPVGAIDMLPSAERDALLAAGRPRHPARPDLPVIDKFEQVARQHALHPALRQVGVADTLTYDQLDARANHLAWHLRENGIRPGDIVGLALPRGLDYVAAVLAVLKVEAAFMPLDPSYPAALLQRMIQQSGAVMLMASDAAAQHLGPQSIPVSLLEQPEMQGSANDAPPRGPHDPQRPAYLIFTSGSSGDSKGVVVSQNAINHHTRAIVEAFNLDPTDRVLQFTSLNFDISIEEILPTLLSGATLVMRSLQMAQELPDFLAAMQQEAITVANLPTAFWHVLCAHLDDIAAPPNLEAHLRLLIVGGERPSPAAAARWRAMFPAIRWMNGYGPTEATITATLYEADHKTPTARDIPIGRPTGGGLAYVMSPDGSLAPSGVSGELWIGGPIVAQGYIGRPDLTEPVFVTDPILGTPARAYRSGDMVSWLPDDLLAYHGRMDRQVKLNGFRIELGAIEVALESAPQVTAAVVGVDNANSAHARLLAWITTRSQMSDDDLAALRTSLRDQLPAFMLPRIIPVDHFPQTPGGKVDLARLPRPQNNEQISSAPANAKTAKVQAIFEQLLRLPQVGPDQSFFEIGGNSLMSVRLMSLLERDFGRRIGLATLYLNATPRLIAAELSRPAEGLDCIVPIQPQGNRPAIFAVHILGANGNFFRPLSDHLGPDQPVIGLTTNLLDPTCPKTLPEIAALYLTSIMRHSPTGPVNLIAVSQGGYIAFELAQQLLAQGREVGGLYLIDATGPGGRPRQRKLRSPAYYLSKFLENGAQILRDRSTTLGKDLHYVLTRWRMILIRQFGGDISRMAHEPSAHQTVIDLAINAYKPKPYPGKITVFRATTPDTDTPAGLASGLGWATVAPGRVRVIDTKGDHLSILAEPEVALFATSLQRVMSETSEAVSR